MFVAYTPPCCGHAFVALDHALIISHPTILACVAQPHCISIRLCPCDIPWYLVWAAWLRPLPLPSEKDFGEHCHLWKLSEIWQEPEGGTVFPFVYISTFFLILLLFIFLSTHFVFIFTCPLIFNSEGVLDFRISTYGLFTILHNTIIVDFPRHLVVTHSLLPIHSFGPFHAAPSDFQHKSHLTKLKKTLNVSHIFLLCFISSKLSIYRARQLAEQ